MSKFSVVLAACKALEKHFGRPRLRKQDPLDSLIAVILSQNTSDRNSIPAFRALKRRFPSWKLLLSAKEKTVAEVIRPAGLANVKARCILRVLRELKSRRQGLDLSFLQDLSTEEAMSFLQSFKGVGPKSAAIVLNFAFHKPVFPVDTHIYRIARRLGVISLKVSRERAQAELNLLVPDNLKTACHLNLITLGRSICKPRNPRCPLCPLRNFCPKIGVAGVNAY